MTTSLMTRSSASRRRHVPLTGGALAVVAAVALAGCGGSTDSGSPQMSSSAMSSSAMSSSAMSSSAMSPSAMSSSMMSASETGSGAMSASGMGAASGASAMMSHGSVIDWATYQSHPAGDPNTTVLLFFGTASGCGLCRSIDADLTSGTADVPPGITVVRVDAANARTLATKYSVPGEPAFVQLGPSGAKVAGWMPTSSDNLFSGLMR